MNRTSNQNTELFKDKTDFLKEGKKFANNVYEHSVDAIQDVEDSVKEYSEKFVEGVKLHPKTSALTTVLILGGISLLVSLLLKKH